jgi:hypothetical protein
MNISMIIMLLGFGVVTEAAQTRIESQVAPSSPATVQDALCVVELASKGGVDELKRMIEAT